jgi:cholesterol oxidase
MSPDHVQNPLARRRFLGLAAGGSLAALAAATLGAPGSRAYAAVNGRTDFPAIVIGSGFGGSVSALRLGQAGVETLILERGKQWTFSNTQAVFASQDRNDNRMFWKRAVADWPLVLPFPMIPYPGVMEVNEDNPDLDIACGAAVGGGSIVYTGATVAPPQRYWDRLYGGRLDYGEFTRTWFPKVRSMLGASTMPDDIYNSPSWTHSRIWNKHAAKAGYAVQSIDSVFDWNIIRREYAGSSRPSATIGETDFGCSNGSKRGLTTNYLPQALATGKVQLQALAEVRSISRNAAGKWEIKVNQQDGNGATISSDTYTSELLFVCAGTLNTNKLLVAARDSGALPDLPSVVGQGFGDNGDQYTGYAHTAEAPGPQQGSACAGTVFAEDLGLPMRAEGWQLMGLHGLPTVMTLSMTADFDNRGTFKYDALTKKVTLKDWTSAKARPSADAANKFNQRMIDRNPGNVPVNVQWPFTLTAHPLGGVTIGRATDWSGRVNGYRGLYVLDGSLIPGTVGGANPSLSITSIAEKCISEIVAAGG